MHFPILPIIITLAGSALAGMHPFLAEPFQNIPTNAYKRLIFPRDKILAL